ncbi:hypothetical protein BDZ45DRAFT_154859 [Acephala macrosclerotiorum]|nr:hypothetical protein BDZ45DRAFT_154859 [Acephala macrosclerotiorum]
MALFPFLFAMLCCPTREHFIALVTYSFGFLSTDSLQSPADLDGYLDVLRSQCEKDWKYPPYSLATKTEFRKIINDHKEIVANGQAGTKTSPDLIQRMTEKFQQVLVGFMIRRTTETKWFRQNIVDLPPDTFTNEPKVKIPARFKPSFKILRSRAQRKMDRDLKKRKAKQKSSQTNAKPAAKKFESASRILRMAETIPALAEIVLEREKNNEKRWELTARELKDKKWYEANDSLYNTYLLRLSNSPKLRLLERSVLKILAKDKLGRDEKVIVFSSFPAIAFIVHLWLQSKNYNSILIHANTKERTELLQGFQEALSAADDDDKPKQKKSAAYRKGENATILVSTPDLIGTGYTLTRAFRAVLMEPAWLKASEKQAFSRVRRIGQENDTFTYRLECDDKDSIEQKIITRQTTRGNIANLCFGDVKDPDAFDQNELKRDKSYNNPMFDDSDTDENRARIQYRKAEAKAGKIAAPRKKAAAKTVKKTTTKTPAKKAAPKKAPKKAAAKNPVKRAGKRKQDGDDDDDGPPPKKRKRRTKAQIAEDKAAGKVAAAKTAVKQEKYLRNFSDDEA